jgi:hypothetical protein
MNVGEDVRMSLRSIQKRPIESLLLILGIALGIGATAAGISLISHSIQAKNELLAQTQYRELLVRIRESAEDMDLAAMPKVGEENVILSWNDLVAKNDVPDIEYGYMANDAQFRIANFSAFGNQAGARPGGQGDGTDRPPPDGAGQAAAQEGGQSREGTGQGGAGNFNPADLPVPDGPEPTIDEIRGLRVSPEYFVAWNLNAAQGSLFTEDEMEDNARVIVLGSNLGATLFEDGQALGRELLLFRNLYTIVGIMEPAGTDVDDAGIIPAQTPNIDRIPQFARQFVGLNTTLHFTVYDPMRLEEARSQLNLWFSQAYGEGRVVISIPRAEVEAAQDRTSRLVSVILFLAIAGLLIASVNVSNILLGRAMRKRKNVGILKALGASIRDVFGLFFIEALILGASGAVLGTGVSVLISKLMVVAISGGAVLSIMLFLGILAAWAVTTSLTVIPALQAARIPAADALRYE